MKIHGTAKGGAINKKDFGVAFSSGGGGSGFDMDKLVAYYKFDNDSGALTNQAAAVGSSDSNGVDFTNNSGVTLDVTGLIDKGYDYDSTDGQSYDGGASTDWEFMYNTTSGVFSFVGWVKPNATGQGNRYVWENSDGENGTGTGLSLASDGKVNWFLSKSDNTDDTIRTPIGSNPNTTAWRMFFVSWDSSDGSVQMSINNGTKTTGTTSMSGNSGTSDTRMNFGSARSSPVLMLDAICDEWSFWNRVLTDDEVTELYNDGDGLAL